MTTMLQSRTLQVSIDRTPQDVYDFVANPENLPLWAPAFCLAVRKADGDWIVETPRGKVKIRFAARNAQGVLDHYVTLPAGVEIHVPMRVLPNGSGSEVIFTLFRSAALSEDNFAEDLTMVGKDLGTLKKILERIE